MKRHFSLPALTALVALALLALSPAAFAQCEFDVEVGDGLSFSVGDTMSVGKDCAEITVNLTHTGSLPVEAMGHNWVLTATSDFQPVAQAGMSAGVAGNYVPADDDRVIAATELVGGGQSTSITFDASVLDPAASYTFFCSFPGHWAAMQGTLEFID